MNKLKRGLLSFGLIGLLTLLGCREFTMGGFQPIDRSKSAYKELYQEKADSMEVNEKNARVLIDYYGSIKKFEEMDKVIKKMVHGDLEKGMRYGDIGDKTYEFFKIKPKKQ